MVKGTPRHMKILIVLISCWTTCWSTLVYASSVQRPHDNLARMKRQWGGAGSGDWGGAGGWAGGSDSNGWGDGGDNGGWEGNAGNGWSGFGGNSGADDDGSVWNPQPAPAPAPAPAPTPAPASAPPKASTTTRQAPAPTTRIANPVLATSAATSTSKHIITLAQPASADNPASAVPESAGQGINSEAGNASLSDGVSSIVNPDERVVAEASPAVPSSVDLSGAQQQTSEESDSSLPAAAVKQKDDSESQNEKEKEKTDSNTDPSWYVTSQDFSLGRSAAYTTTSHPTSLLLYSFALLVVAFLLLQ